MEFQSSQRLTALNPSKKIAMSQQADALKAFAVEAGVIDQETAARIENAQKPTVILPGGETSITQSATELFSHIAPKEQLFLRDGNVCQLNEKDGILRLELLKPAAACSRFEDFVRFVKKIKTKDGKEMLAPEVISKETAEKYLAATARFQLPTIEGLLNCPLLTERKGHLHVVASGYDATTRLLITKTVPLEDIPLDEAVENLTSILQDFQFQTPGDHSRALASLITPALKFGGFIKGPIPADAAEADQSQAGKSYRQQMNAAVYNETCAVVTKPETAGVGGLEEGFSSALVEGRPFIQFDNVRGKFSLQGLESFMTAAGSFPARPAYSKVIQVDPSKFMIMISSNGYQTTVDLSNRSSIIRIFKRPGYSFRTWAPKGIRRGGMLEFIQDVQPMILSSVFAVVREWHQQGKPRTNDTRHDFREWCQVLDWIVQNIFQAAPLMDGHQAAQARVASPDHAFIRQLALALSKHNQLNKPFRANELFDISEEEGLYVPGVSKEKLHEEKDFTTALGKLMKRVFGDSDETEVDVFTVSRSNEKVESGAHHTYYTYFYTFRRTHNEEPDKPSE